MHRFTKISLIGVLMRVSVVIENAEMIRLNLMRGRKQRSEESIFKPVLVWGQAAPSVVASVLLILSFWPIVHPLTKYFVGIIDFVHDMTGRRLLRIFN